MLKQNKLLISFLLIISFCLVGQNQCNEKPCVTEINKLPLSQDIGIVGDSMFAHNYQVCKDVGSQLSLMMGIKVPQVAVGGARLSCEVPKLACLDSTNLSIQYFEKLKAVQQVPKIVIIDGGGNDIIYECPQTTLPACSSTVTKTLAEIMNLLSAIQAEQKQIIFMGYANIINPNLTKFNPAIDSLMDGVKTFCQQRGIKFIDLEPLFTDPSLYAEDGVHSSPAGSLVIANAIHTELIQMTYHKTTFSIDTDEPVKEPNFLEKLFNWFLSLVQQLLGAFSNK